MKDDHRSYNICKFCSCKKKAWKKFRLEWDSNPWPLPYWCSALGSRVRILYKPEFFFRRSFGNCKSCICNYDDHPSFNSSLLGSHTWFSYNKNLSNILVDTCPKEWTSPTLQYQINPDMYRVFARALTYTYNDDNK